MCLLQMLSFMRAQYTLFQQGFNILDEIDPYMKKLAAQVRRNRAENTLCPTCPNKEMLLLPVVNQMTESLQEL